MSHQTSDLGCWGKVREKLFRRNRMRAAAATFLEREDLSNCCEYLLNSKILANEFKIAENEET